MTGRQIEDFSKLELTYLEAVITEDVEKQMQTMDLIFFWLKKQIAEARMKIIVQLPHDPNTVVSPAITDEQKKEFAFLQIEMIHPACRGDKSGMVLTEMRMRKWIDDQIAQSTGGLFKPKMRIVPDDQKN